MFSSKKSTVLVLLFLTLVIFLIFVYFFWQPDSLIKFAPSKKLFYLHFDLNAVRRAGKFGNNWFEREQTEVFLEKLFEANENLSLVENIFKNKEVLDEIGLIGLWETPPEKNVNPKINLVFLLKTKKWTEPSLIYSQMRDFRVKKLTDRIWEVSLREYVLAENIVIEKNGFLRRNFSFSKIMHPSWVRGYFYPGVMELPDREDSNEMIRINCFSLGVGSDDLFFELESLINEKRNVLSLNDFGEKSEQMFVLIFPRDGSMNDFENKIKMELALKNPVEENVLLPDGTNFIELKADPGVYEFIKEEVDGFEVKSLKFLTEQESLEIFLHQDQKYFYISNQRHLFKAIDGAISLLNQNQLIKGVYLFINDKGVRDLTIIENPESIKGVLRII